MKSTAHYLLSKIGSQLIEELRKQKGMSKTARILSFLCPASTLKQICFQRSVSHCV